MTFLTITAAIFVARVASEILIGTLAHYINTRYVDPLPPRSSSEPIGFQGRRNA